MTEIYTEKQKAVKSQLAFNVHYNVVIITYLLTYLLNTCNYHAYYLTIKHRGALANL